MTTLTAPRGADLRHDLKFKLADGSDYDLSGAVVSVVLTPPRGGDPVTLTPGAGLVDTGEPSWVSLSVDKATLANWAQGVWKAQVFATEGTSDALLFGFLIDVCTFGYQFSGETTVVVGSTEVTQGGMGPAGVPFPNNGKHLTESAPLFNLSQILDNAAELFGMARISATVIAAAAGSHFLAFDTNDVDQHVFYLDGSAYHAGDVAVGGGLTVGGDAVWTAGTFDPADYALAGHGHVIGDIANLQAALDGKLDDADAANFAAANHGHGIGAIAGLQAALDGKLDDADAANFAAANHGHGIGAIAGLQAALDGKLDDADAANFAAANHIHAMADVTGLIAALATKLDAASFTWGNLGGKPDTAAAMGLTDVVFLTGNQAIAGTKTFDDLRVMAAGALKFAGRSQIQSSVDGYLGLYNAAGTDFIGLRWGGLTSAYPMLVRSGAVLQARLADDSARTGLEASTLGLTGDLTVGGKITLGGDAVQVRDAANVWALRNGTNLNTARFYETYTDPSNYARLVITTSGTTYDIRPEGAGTGSAKSLRLFGGNQLDLGGAATAQWRLATTGNWSALSHNSYDFGSLTAAARSIYAGTNISAGNLYLFGGTTNLFPAWKRSTTGIVARLADDSADTWLQASSLIVGLGTAGAPSLAPSGVTDLGLSFGSTNFIGLSVGGTVRAALASTTWLLHNGASFGWSSGTVAAGGAADLSLFREAADTLAQRRGTNAQAHYWYTTFTDASNNERFGIVGAAGSWTIGNAGVGTGSNLDVTYKAAGWNNIQGGGSRGVRLRFNGGTIAWEINASGHLMAGTTGTYDIGATGGVTCPRDVYITGNYRGQAVIMTAGVTCGAGNIHGWNGRSALYSSADGQIEAKNNANTAFAQFTGSVLRSVGVTVANLPGAAAAGDGARGFVTDATQTLAAGLGAVVAGGGANKVPVYSDGANWLIG